MLMTAPVELSQELRDEIRQQVEALRDVVDRLEELLTVEELEEGRPDG